MKAKELIKKLQQLDPDTEIYTNQWMEADINEILLAKDKDTGECHAYVGDDFDELQYELEYDNYTTKRF